MITATRRFVGISIILLDWWFEREREREFSVELPLCIKQYFKKNRSLPHETNYTISHKNLNPHKSNLFCRCSRTTKMSTTIFSRFLTQKNGLANVVMAFCCVSLSGQLLQRREEFLALKEELEKLKKREEENNNRKMKKKKKRRMVGWF